MTPMTVKQPVFDIILGISIIGRLARYNSPFTPSFLRHNELLIDVEMTL
jgi:hypothetical protein